tara:strand:+ start:671 stop:1246 length:576 start_codon:yes stop_codon:yes gene_type:complete
MSKQEIKNNKSITQDYKSTLESLVDFFNYSGIEDINCPVDKTIDTYTYESNVSNTYTFVGGLTYAQSRYENASKYYSTMQASRDAWKAKDEANQEDMSDPTLQKLNDQVASAEAQRDNSIILRDIFMILADRFVLNALHIKPYNCGEVKKFYDGFTKHHADKKLQAKANKYNVESLHGFQYEGLKSFSKSK